MASRTVDSLEALSESTEAMLQSIAAALTTEGHLPQLGAWR
jgi:hypothetical protein